MNVLLIVDEGVLEMVDVVMVIGVCVGDVSGYKFDGDVIFEKWFDICYLIGKSVEGFKCSLGFVVDMLEMCGCWCDFVVIYCDVVVVL